jgi:hypothetical protein
MGGGPPPAAVRLLRGGAAVLCWGGLALCATACESTERESAAIAREGHHLLAAQAGLRLGGSNTGARVSGVTVLSGGGRTAVAVRLTVTGAGTQTDVPLLLNVAGAGGKVLYSNSTGGLEPALQRVPLLRPGQGVWWVDDQVLTTQTPTGASARLGRGGSPRSGGAIPDVAAEGAHLEQRSGLPVVSGTLVNRSPVSQSKVPVYAVALRGQRVTAAGRAVVETLPAHSSAPFEIFLVGNPTGASLQLTATPTSL